MTTLGEYSGDSYYHVSNCGVELDDNESSSGKVLLEVTEVHDVKSSMSVN